MKVIVGVLLAILVVDLSSLWLQSVTTSVTMAPEVGTVGANTPIDLQIANTDGVRSVTAWIEQNGSRVEVFEQRSTPHWMRWKRNQPPTHVHFEIDKDKILALKPGKAQLIVAATGDDFRSNTDTKEFAVNIK